MRHCAYLPSAALPDMPAMHNMHEPAAMHTKALPRHKGRMELTTDKLLANKLSSCLATPLSGQKLLGTGQARHEPSDKARLQDRGHYNLGQNLMQHTDTQLRGRG